MIKIPLSAGKNMHHQIDDDGMIQIHAIGVQSKAAEKISVADKNFIFWRKDAAKNNAKEKSKDQWFCVELAGIRNIGRNDHIKNRKQNKKNLGAPPDF